MTKNEAMKWILSMDMKRENSNYYLSSVWEAVPWNFLEYILNMG